MRTELDRVTRVTEELRALFAQLQWKTFQSSSPGDKTQILNELLNSCLVEELKTALDQLSRFLWCYINSAAAANSILEADDELQSRRLEQITQVLRTLNKSSSPSEDPSAFVERVMASVDQHLETHNQRELPLERSA